MNNQEAIALLGNLEDSLDSYCELNEDGKKAFHMAIESLELFGNSEQLPSAHPTQTNTPNTLETLECEYCHEDIEGYVKPIEKNGHAFVRFGMNGWELSLKANGWHGSAKIKYCPMCGRDLLVKGGA